MRQLFFKKVNRKFAGSRFGIAFMPFAVLFIAGGQALAASCLDGFSLYSGQQTFLRDRVTVESGKTGSNGYLELGVDGIAKGNFVAVGDILLRDRASVLGNATAGGIVTLSSGADVSGFIQEGAVVPNCNIPEESISPGNNNINVYAGSTVELPPGSAGNVVVYSNGQLVLSSGNYHFQSLTLHADAEIFFTADSLVAIHTQNSLSIGDRSRFTFQGGFPWPTRLKWYAGQTSTVFIGTDLDFYGTLISPQAGVSIASRTEVKGAIYAGGTIDVQPDSKISYVPLEIAPLPDLYPPTYVPGQTSFLQACEQAFDNPPSGGLPEGTEWVPACSTAIKNKIFAQKVTNQIPGRDLGANPPKIANMVAFPLDPPTSEGNALLEVEYVESLPDTVNFIWDGEVKTLRDDGGFPDDKAGDGFYYVVMEVDFASLPAPEEGEEGIPVPIFGREIVRQSSSSTGEVDLSAKAIPEPLLTTCGDIHNPGPNCPMHPEKVFMIRDLDVVNNPERTSDPCLNIAEGNVLGEATKKWTFGYLMSQMANQGATGISPSEFALDWLDNWHTSWPINGDLINGQELPHFAEVAGEDPEHTLPKRLKDRWLFASELEGAPPGTVLMKLAPFRLLAIVNRFDLRKSSEFGGELAGGELRFVFTPLILTLETAEPIDACKVMGIPISAQPEEKFLHTVILEYAVDLGEENSVRNWAQSWADLDEINMFDPQGVDQYLQALEALTEQVVVAGRGELLFPPRGNGSALSQLRTNETVIQVDWDFREFVIDGASNVPVPVTVKNAPADIMNESDILGQWILDRKDMILSEAGDTIPFVVPSGYPPHPHPEAPFPYFMGARTINSAGSGSHDVKGFWQPASGFLDYSDSSHRAARHKLSLNTCSACHGKETEQPRFDGVGLFFAHVMPRRYDEVSKLSNFLTGLPANPDNLKQNPVFVPDPVTVGTDLEFNALTWTGSKFVAVGVDVGAQFTVVSSLDGSDFTLNHLGAGILYALEWNGAEVVAVGRDGELFSSPDGLTWNGLNSGVVPNDLNAVLWVTGHPESDRWVAVGEQGVVTTSTNGVTWTAATTGPSSTLHGLAWNGTNLVAVGESGRILNSPDGNTWTDATGATSGTLRSVTWAGSQFVAVGDGVILTSPSGFTWTLRADNFPVNFRSVTWTGSHAVAVGSAGSVLSSTDGINWTTHNSPTTFEQPHITLNSVVWTGTELATAGEISAFYTAPGPAGAWTPVAEGDRYRYFEDLHARYEDLKIFLSPGTQSPSMLSFSPTKRIH